MVTITEYKAHVQELKRQFQERGAKVNNLKTQQIAIVTICVYITKFVALLINILTEAGYDVHWYHYSEQDTKELNMKIELQDLRDQYDRVVLFEDIAAAAVSTVTNLIGTSQTASYCLIGRCSIILTNLVNLLLQNGNDVAAIIRGNPTGHARNYDIIIMVDGYIHSLLDKPIIKIFPWGITSSEETMVYDLSEEIAIRIGESLIDDR